MANMKMRVNSENCIFGASKAADYCIWRTRPVLPVAGI
jgi:hypothetical protein